jgi:hypothetical protein
MRSTRRVLKATPLLERSSSVPSTRSPSTMSRQFTASSQTTPPIGTRSAVRRVVSISADTARRRTSARSGEW